MKELNNLLKLKPNRWREAYMDILSKKREPFILMINGDCYNITPKAVVDLIFFPDYLEFTATYSGKVKTIKLKYREMAAIIEQDPDDC